MRSPIAHYPSRVLFRLLAITTLLWSLCTVALSNDVWTQIRGTVVSLSGRTLIVQLKQDAFRNGRTPAFEPSTESQLRCCWVSTKR